MGGDPCDRRYGVTRSLIAHTALFALIPAIAGYIGTTRTGWQIGAGDVVRLTEASAARIAVLYYVAMARAIRPPPSPSPG